MRSTSGRPMFKSLALAALSIVAALALGACGDSHTKVSGGTYAGESGANAPYLDVGPLVYEVQISRQLNPYDVEDSSYLVGLTPAQRRLAPGEEWFGVFLQVYNNTEAPHLAAPAVTMKITDTQKNVYVPIEPNATNPFAYRAGVVPAKSRVPAPNTVASFGPTQGALLLYKISIVSLDNRPLTLKLVDPLNPANTASAELDV
ncbi:MAG: hypothetical protein ACHQDY_07235 [Solirubrobacterales bacterium]